MSDREEAANGARATQREDQEDEGLLDTVGHTFGAIARDRADAPDSTEKLERGRLANDEEQRR
jgi:hypothetical protein